MTFMDMRRCYQAINEQQCLNTVVCLYVWLHYSYGWICLISLWELWRNHVRQRTNKSTGPDLNAPILCVGDSVCAGVCADSDGGQSREQIQQSWPVRHLRYAEQWLCFRIPDRWGRHRTQTLMYTPHKLLRNRKVLYWSMCPPPPSLSPSLSLSVTFCFIVDALYRSTYPEYLQYIYLVAPVSLMLLNPIGFALCEVQKWRQSSHPQHSTAGIVGVVVVQVLFIHLCKRFKVNSHSKCNTPCHNKSKNVFVHVWNQVFLLFSLQKIFVSHMEKINIWVILFSY